MSKQFVKINSFSASDVQDLFDFICENILKKKPEEVKNEVSAFFSNAPRMFKGKEVTITELINTIMVFDIKFELKLNWINNEKQELPPVKNKNQEGLKLNPEEKLLKEQGSKTSETSSDKEEEIPNFE